MNSFTGISSICEISVNNYSDTFYLDTFLFGFGVNISSPYSCFRKLTYSTMRSNN